MRALRNDKGAKTPFSAVALLILLLSSTMTTVMMERTVRDAGKMTEGVDLEMVMGQLHGDVGGVVQLVSDDLVSSGIATGEADHDILEELNVSVAEGLSGISHDGVVLEFTGLHINMVWKEADIVDIVASDEEGGEDVVGEAARRVAGNIVGTVNVTIFDNVTSDMLTARIAFDEPVAVGTALAGQLLEQMVFACEGLSGVGDKVRYMVDKLVIARLYNGETDSKKLLTNKDVSRLLEIAIELELAQKFRSFSDGGIETKVANGDDLFDIVMDEFGYTSVSASAIMAQYIMGLTNHWVGWIVDYLDPGDNGKALWDGMGSKLNISGTLLSISDLVTDTWVEVFSVKDTIRAWLQDLLRELLDVVMTLLDLERIDISDLNGEDWADTLSERFENIVDDHEVFELDLPDMELSDDLFESIAGVGDHIELLEGRIPGWSDLMDAWNDLKAEFKLEDKTVKDFIIEQLVREDVIEDFAGDMLDLLYSGVERVRVTIIEMALLSVKEACRSVQDMEDMVGMTGELPMLAGVPLMGKEEAKLTRGKAVQSVTPSTRTLEHRVGITMEGVENTEPKTRYNKVKELFDLEEPEPMALFENILPYQLVYSVDIDGTLIVRDADIVMVDTVTGLMEQQTAHLERRIPINISFNLPVNTGSPLKNHDYDPSNTLVSDVAAMMQDFIDQTWKSIRQFPDALMAAGRGIIDKLGQLGAKAMENLMKQNALWFYNIMNALGKAVYSKDWSNALDVAFEICDKLIGKELAQEMTLEVKLDGLRIWFTPFVCSRSISVGFETEHFSMELVMKQHSRSVYQGNRYSFLIKGTIDYGNFHSDTTFDPFLLTQKSMFVTNVVVPECFGKELRMRFAYPQLVKQFEKYEVSLQSVFKDLVRFPVGPGVFASVDFGLRVRYLTYSNLSVMMEKVLDAVKKAFEKILGQFTLEEIFGEELDLDTFESFLVQLVQNIIDALIGLLDKTVPEVEMFFEGYLEEASGTGEGGFSLSIVVKNPFSCLYAAFGWIMESMRNFLVSLGEFRLPTYTMPPAHVLDFIFLRLEVFFRIDTPDFVKKGCPKAPGDLKMAVRIEVSLSAMLALFGQKVPRTHVRFGLIAPDVPAALVSWWPGLKVGKMKASDLWFIEGDIWWLGKEELMISEVLYKPDGADADLEYVEIYNPTKDTINVHGWCLKDNAGEWKFRDDLMVSPGEYIVVVRKGGPFKETWGSVYDADGLTLNLNNAGDKLELVDPSGRKVDKVAWDGIDGWTVTVEKGYSLVRDTDMDDTDTDSDWFYAYPSPGEPNR